MLVFVIFAAAVATAADSGKTNPTEPKPKPAVVCHSVTPLGSRLPVRVCRPAAMVEQDKVEAQDATRAMQNVGVPPSN